MGRTPYWKRYENDLIEGITYNHENKIRYGFGVFSDNYIKMFTKIKFEVL